MPAHLQTLKLLLLLQQQHRLGVSVPGPSHTVPVVRRLAGEGDVVNQLQQKRSPQQPHQKQQQEREAHVSQEQAGTTAVGR